MKIWIDQTAKSLSREWALTAKSLREGWFTSVFRRDCHFVEQFFNLRQSDQEREWRGSWPKVAQASREQNIERTLNQDFVAPAPYHLPIERRDWSLLSWHPHCTKCLLRRWVSEWESTSIGRERLLESCLWLWKKDRNAQMKYPRVWGNDHHCRANHVTLQGKNDSSTQLDNSSRRLPFYGRILQFWPTTNQQRPESTFECRGKARNRDRFNELTFTGTRNIPFQSSEFILFVSNSYLIVISERFCYHPDGKVRLSWDFFWSRQKTSIIQASAIKISWHPHNAIYPCELRDWSLLSWHPHPTICLLR